MKSWFFLGIFLFAIHWAKANTYYSINNSAPNLTSSWHANRNGTGSNPSGFNSTDIFIIQANHAMTTTANWNLSGNAAKIIIESGGTLNANHKISVDIFQVNSGGTYVHNDNSATIPGTNSRSFSSTSTVEIRNWNGTGKLPESTIWGNLVIDLGNYNSNINQAGKLTDIAGDFIIRSTGNNNKEFRLAGNQDYTLTIGGDLVIEGGVLEASSGNGNANQTITINGSLRQSGGTFMRSNANGSALEVRFNGVNSHYAKTAGTLSNSHMKWKVNAGKKLTLESDFSLLLSSSLTVDGTLDCEEYTLDGQGSFTLSSTGKIITSKPSGLSGSLNLSGPVLLTDGASYQFETYTTTPFPMTAAPVSASAIVINAGLMLNRNVTLSSTLILNSGKLVIPPGYVFTVTSPSVIAGNSFNASKYISTEVNKTTGVKGYFRIQNLSGTVPVPMGAGDYYLPLTLTVAGNNDFSICTFSGITANGQPNGTPLSILQKKDVVDAVWIINRNSGANEVNMQFAWPDALEGSSFATIENSRIGISHYGSYWEPAFGFGNQTLNNAVRTAVTGFSPFSVATGNIPLPLRFGDMKLTEKNGVIQINWYSLAEAGLSQYDIERSTDGRNFVSLGKINAAGNSTSRKDYTWNDSVSTDGIFFYRIKAIDVDLKYFYSGVARIKVIQKNEDLLTIYPNPVTEQRINISAYLPADRYSIIVFDQAGRHVYRQLLNHPVEGITNMQIWLSSPLKKGPYVISVTGSLGTKRSKSFLVK